MVKITEADFLFKVHGIEIEGFDDIGVDVQYPWEDSPRRYHEHIVHVKSFWMDKYPVSNADFKKFLDATHYRPADDLDFLRDCRMEHTRRVGGTSRSHGFPWRMRARMPPGLESGCRANGVAICRPRHRWPALPVGNQWDASAVPVPDKGRTMRGPDTVSAHPKA